MASSMTLSVLVALSLVACSAAFLSSPSSFAPRAQGKSISQRLTPSIGLRSPVLPQKLASSRRSIQGALNLAAKVKAEYIWIGGRGGGGDDYRAKTRVLDTMPKSVDDLPLWNYDGSSTGQAPGEDSEVYLKPAYMCKDPMRSGDAILVLCEMMNPDMTPIPTNTRTEAAKIFEGHEAEEPWFGIEQEYTLFQDGVPLGWPKSGARPFAETSPLYQFGYPGEQGPYYCGVGYDVSFGRLICEEHLDYCLAAGLDVSGINGEVMPGQWEYQVGPAVGINAGDQLHMTRFLLHRVCEENGVVCSFDPKPIPGNWNGAGCHTNFSTKKMREDGGLKAITDACDKYGIAHEKHIKLYGAGNERRLTGDCETNSIDSFKYGVADRGASIRIPRFTDRDGKGYLEDRRPASNMDPYVVTALMFDTGILKGDTTAFDHVA
eukprot:CAMPEP_0181313150 /NCGR_PEP_ID=MMETSP1101-20121128/14094_1 /TAXON_ID=46948 /ORGANISM="Rhodomonas abbreviata, Strain Caron Lab Isolate" /LENGTH=432 /DNA_ID=CAMNT_0023420083 /DNA_START=8 /DNA_END=1306 /DNA_ORIENTATION=-